MITMGDKVLLQEFGNYSIFKVLFKPQPCIKLKETKASHLNVFD